MKTISNYKSTLIETQNTSDSEPEQYVPRSQKLDKILENKLCNFVVNWSWLVFRLNFADPSHTILMSLHT